MQRYRRRLVGRRPRVVCATPEAMQQVLAKHGGQLNTLFAARLHLDFRQHVAAIGRWVHTVWKHEGGWRQHLALVHTYHHVCLPHASRRLPLAALEPTNGTRSVGSGGLVDQPWQQV